MVNIAATFAAPRIKNRWVRLGCSNWPPLYLVSAAYNAEKSVSYFAFPSSAAAGKRSHVLSENDDGLSPLARAMRNAQPWMNAVSKLTGSALAGVLGGYWLDKWTGWKPWGLVAMSLLFITVGMYAFLKDALSMGKKKP